MTKQPISTLGSTKSELSQINNPITIYRDTLQLMKSTYLGEGPARRMLDVPDGRIAEWLEKR